MLLDDTTILLVDTFSYEFLSNPRELDRPHPHRLTFNWITQSLDATGPSTSRPIIFIATPMESYDFSSKIQIGLLTPFKHDSQETMIQGSVDTNLQYASVMSIKVQKNQNAAADNVYACGGYWLKDQDEKYAAIWQIHLADNSFKRIYQVNTEGNDNMFRDMAFARVSQEQRYIFAVRYADAIDEPVYIHLFKLDPEEDTGKHTREKFALQTYQSL